jgi:hypothetical protein
VVGFTTGSRGEVPGKRKPVIREQHDDDDDDDNNNSNNDINNTFACPALHTQGFQIYYLITWLYRTSSTHFIRYICIFVNYVYI